MLLLKYTIILLMLIVLNEESLGDMEPGDFDDEGSQSSKSIFKMTQSQTVSY